MIYSMTGYGRKEFQIGEKNIIIEIRALNGKQLDVNCKLAGLLKPFEHEIRKKIQEILVRGSVDCSILVLQSGSNKPMQVNTQVFKNYFQTIQGLASELNMNTTDLLPAILSLPEVVSADVAVVSEEEWKSIQPALDEAMQALIDFRIQEGKGLAADLKLRIQNILNLLEEVSKLDPVRNEKVREKLLKAVQSLGEELTIDMNRLEQELIYYIEKIDISEEKQRLAQHCHLFFEILNQADNNGVGKKLNFVLQEIGREINTLGSKANDATIQKLVINMKDELEKAKEQSLNIL